MRKLIKIVLHKLSQNDICVIISSESISQLENIAQKAFTKFKHWAVKNKLELDKNKIEAFLFINNHKCQK